MPIIANCNLYCGNDTGFMHISAALNLKTVALFMDSPVMAYGKYSKFISVIIPQGETEETTTHNTLGKEKINKENTIFNYGLGTFTNLTLTSAIESYFMHLYFLFPSLYNIMPDFPKDVYDFINKTTKSIMM